MTHDAPDMSRTGFAPATYAAWEERVKAVLKNGKGAESLVQQAADGFAIKPLYGSKIGPRAERASHNPWQILQRLDHPDPARAAAIAQTEIAGGGDGLVLVAADSPSAYGLGIKAGEDLAPLLAGLKLHQLSLRLEGGADLAQSLARFIAAQPLDPARLKISFGLKDPALIPALQAQGFMGPFVTAEGTAYHNRGATAGQELGVVLADAVALLRQMAGLGLSAPHQAIDFKLAATQDMFMTLAKFRALRLLWQKVLAESGYEAEPALIHGESSYRMMARLDPHTNILRATAALFGASLGGADSFTLLPFSLKQGSPNDFARRVARNGQLLLREEAELWRVSDPASGSGYVESLTENLCQAAWAVFQEIERSGQRPSFDPDNKDGEALIGTALYRLPTEYDAAIEVSHG